MEATSTLSSQDLQSLGEVRSVFLLSACLVALVIVTVVWRHEARYRTDMKQLSHWNAVRSKLSAGQVSYNSDSSSSYHSRRSSDGYIYISSAPSALSPDSSSASSTSSVSPARSFRRSFEARSSKQSFDQPSFNAAIVERRSATAAAAAAAPPAVNRGHITAVDLHSAAFIDRHRACMDRRRMSLDMHREAAGALHRQQVHERHAHRQQQQLQL